MNTPSTCPHFSLCSGCTLAENIYCPPIWKEVKNFFHLHGLEPPLIADGFIQTRLKAKLAVRPGPGIGLFKRNTHEVISIPHCLVHHPSINKAVAFIQEEMIRCNLLPYCESTGRGTLRYLQLFVERATQKVQLALIVKEPPAPSFVRSLLKGDLWHSIWLNYHPAPSNRVLGEKWELIYGEPFLWQTLNGVPIAFHPGAFSQTHLSLFETMLQKIASWVSPSDSILELYAGVGAIGLTLPNPHITLVESNPFAFLSFQQSRRDIPYLCIDAKEADLSGYSLLIVDPPRKGLDPLLLTKISQISAGKLIYVSCGFESFQRDAEKLLSAGWRFKEAAGYLLFPGTNHVEVMASLEK